MKGIILAGGRATRLYPITKGLCKQMLPVYDKPMIYYPLSVLMLAGIRDILIISTPDHLLHFEKLLGNGKSLGISLSYAVQEEPRGIAEAFIIGRDFIGLEKVCLILGDNIFYGHGLSGLLEKSVRKIETDGGALILGYWMEDPHRYAVVEFDKDESVLSLQEKPKVPKSNYAVVGLYFYDNEVIEIASSIKPSKRGELEITDVNKEYLRRKRLTAEMMGRGYAWLDTGMHDSLLEASNFVATIEHRQGLKLACIEEIAYRRKYIDEQQMCKIAEPFKNSQYGQYILNLIKR